MTLQNYSFGCIFLSWCLVGNWLLCHFILHCQCWHFCKSWQLNLKYSKTIICSPLTCTRRNVYLRAICLIGTSWHGQLSKYLSQKEYATAFNHWRIITLTVMTTISQCHRSAQHIGQTLCSNSKSDMYNRWNIKITCTIPDNFAKGIVYCQHAVLIKQNRDNVPPQEDSNLLQMRSCLTSWDWTISDLTTISNGKLLFLHLNQL